MPFPFVFGRKSLLALILLSLFATAIRAGNDELPLGKARKAAAKAMRAGDFDQAIQTWQEIVRREPDKIENRLALSYAFYKQKRLVDSYKEAMNALELDRNNARGRSLVGAVYLAAGRIDEARDILHAAITLNPDDALGLSNSALIDFYENRSKIGLTKLRRATFLEANEPDFVYALAQIAAHTENYKESADAYAKFLRIAPATDSDRRDRIVGLIEFLRYLGAVKSLYEVGGNRQTTVSCETVNNRPVINVRVNNRRETLRFVLDTGSGMTVVSEETAQKLGINPVARGGMASAVGGGGKFPIVYGLLDSIEIGEARVSKIPVYIRRFHTDGDRFDGYIGLSAISKFLITLDYQNNTLSLVKNFAEKSDKKNALASSSLAVNVPTGDKFSVPLRTTSSGFLSGTINLEGVAEPLNFIFDTGASVSVVSSETLKRGQINSYMQAAMLRVYGAAGTTDNVATLLLPRVSCGDLSREKVMAAVLDLAPINETAGFEQAGILGGNFLRNYRLTFDFQKATLTFEK